MTSDEQIPSTQYRVFHKCTHCGHLVSRREMPETAFISGIIECPRCGEATALNLTVEDEGQQDDEKQKSTTRRS